MVSAEPGEVPPFMREPLLEVHSSEPLPIFAVVEKVAS